MTLITRTTLIIGAGVLFPIIVGFDRHEPCCDGVHVSYQSQIKPILKTTCALATCHTSEERRGDFLNFTDVEKVALNGKLLKKVQKGKMPPADTKGPKTLSQEQIKLLNCWVQQGALNN